MTYQSRSDDLLIGLRDRVLTLTLNRPDKLNALSPGMIAGALEALAQAGADPQVGAILVIGSGRAFCAGGDVSAMSAAGGDVAERPTFEERVDLLRHGQELSWRLHSIPKPTLAAVNGYAMGAGLGIALSCDLRVASAQARLGTAYAKVGFGGDYGVTWQLTRLVGPARAKELLFFADVVEASEAQRLGLVNRVLDDEGFAEAVHQLAARLAHGPTVSYRWMKENVNLAVTSEFRSLLDREAITHLRCGETADHREGVAAFLEKRAPKFEGR
ncbi:MAG TPA: enoyl-CoA hydratase [Thermoanaerobaculia bacterium]|nr:enoyl-CoA hydratase [Thermoanaerobaculia bacterium]